MSTSFKTRDTDASKLHTHPLGHLGPTANRTAGSSSLFRSESERADVELGFRPVRDGEQVSDELWQKMQAAVHPQPTATPAPTAPTPGPKPHASSVLLPKNFRRDANGIFFAADEPAAGDLVGKLVEEKAIRAAFAKGTAEWNQRVREQRVANGTTASAVLLKKKGQ